MSKFLAIVFVHTLMACVYAQQLAKEETKQLMLSLVPKICQPNLATETHSVVAQCEANVPFMFKMSFANCVRESMNIQKMTLPFVCYRQMPGGEKIKECMLRRQRVASRLGMDVDAIRNRILDSYANCLKVIL